MNNTKRNKYRVVIVGTGGISGAHARACLQNDQTDLVAVCDVSQTALDSFAQQFEVDRRYTVLEEMLEKEQIDITITCTGAVYQPAVAIQIAESGRVKTMLCEKPLTQTAADAEALIAACRNNGVLVAEGWKFRHHPQHLKAKQIIEGGGIGEVMHILSTFYNRFEDRSPNTSRFIRSVGGGAVRWMGCYNLHHALWIFGEEPERVYAAQMPGAEVDDAASALLSFSGGRTALISAGHNSWNSEIAEILGTSGLLRTDKAFGVESRDCGQGLHAQVMGDLEHHTADGVARYQFEPADSFGLQLQHLLDCIESGQPHRVTPEQSIAHMKVIDAVFESLESGKLVALGSSHD
jgi:predicted dehydrogenase